MDDYFSHIKINLPKKRLWIGFYQMTKRHLNHHYDTIDHCNFQIQSLANLEMKRSQCLHFTMSIHRKDPHLQLRICPNKKIVRKWTYSSTPGRKCNINSCDLIRYLKDATCVCLLNNFSRVELSNVDSRPSQIHMLLNFLNQRHDTSY